MKFAAALLVAFVLSGCAQWSQHFHGSWLDDAGKPRASAPPMSDEEAGALTVEAVRLRTEAEGIRMKLALEKDRVRRIAYLRTLRDIGDRLHPIERMLQNAGRTVPAVAT